MLKDLERKLLEQNKPDFPTIKLDYEINKVEHVDQDALALTLNNDIINQVYVRFADEQEEVIMRKIQYLGRTVLEEITLDKQKILEALEKCYKPQFVMYLSTDSLSELTLRRCKCPRCKYDLTGLIRYPHCPYCGQKLDWEGR